MTQACHFSLADGDAAAAGALPPVERTRRVAPDSGLLGLAFAARRYRIGTDPEAMAHELGLGGRRATPEEVVRAATQIGLKARLLKHQSEKRLKTVPTPALLCMRDGSIAVFATRLPAGGYRLFDPVSRRVTELSADGIAAFWQGSIILLTRRAGGAGIDPETFSIRWFLPSIWRYRKALGHVLLASLFIQLFALITPLFFQLVINKVLLHNSCATLAVVATGLAIAGIFDVGLQYLRAYALNHTTSRIDVELGSRLMGHLLRLPLGYFEKRPAGQTVARMRELEVLRSFLTGQCLSSIIDIFFSAVLVGVLYIYSPFLTLIVVSAVPAYVVIAMLIRPMLRQKISERFYRNAASQQFLVESVVGIQTLKSAAVEPILRSQWEEKLAAYVRTSFQTVMLASAGQNAIQYVSKVTTAAVLFFGALAVMNGELSVGALVAFNMMQGQVTQPILHLSQLWQDFQQAQVSVERIGDILNAAPESRPTGQASLPPARGSVKFTDVMFRYDPGGPEVLRNVSLLIPEGQVLGIVGPSGSGKSTLAKLILGLSRPERGQILVDDIDTGQADTVWLRRQIGVVQQENLLFNRTIHENIALATPGAPRAAVLAAAKLAGADEFITRLPLGYDTQIEERGANLSGGQRQRIAIARALITRPRILILDEATSALDYESERIIQYNMRRIAKGRTVIVIAHRLATVRHCDRIIAIRDGAIVEDGTHEELLRLRDGAYARLWRMQAGIDEAEAAI